MVFAFTALNASGERLHEVIEAENLQAAQNELMQRGLFVLSVTPRRGLSGVAANGLLSIGGSTEESGLTGGSYVRAKPRGSLMELALFARQMAMMQKAGGSLVPAIRAILDQPGRRAFHAMLHDLAENLEGGASLSSAMARHPLMFPPNLRSIIAAGEATGTLGEAFARLSALLDGRVRIRRKLISATSYPAVLLLMALSTMGTMTAFVLPRFADLFKMLDTPLPASTRFMLDASEWLKTWWPIALSVPVAATIAAVLWLRSSTGKRMLGTFLVKAPFIGKVTRAVIGTQLMQLWAALLRSRVALMDAVQHAAAGITNPVFAKMIADVDTALTEGRGVADALRKWRLLPPPVVAAIATGEETGKLGEAAEFAATWMEEESGMLVTSLTKTLEPLILVVLGVVVGGVAISLFLPLFDIATAAG